MSSFAMHGRLRFRIHGQKEIKTGGTSPFGFGNFKKPLRSTLSRRDLRRFVGALVAGGALLRGATAIARAAFPSGDQSASWLAVPYSSAE